MTSTPPIRLGVDIGGIFTDSQRIRRSHYPTANPKSNARYGIGGAGIITIKFIHLFHFSFC